MADDNKAAGKIEVPISVVKPVTTAHGGVYATNLEDVHGLMDVVRNQIQKLLPGPAKDFIAKAQANSIWMLTFGLACCAIEMMATGTADYDLDRLGIIPRASPRQADLMIIAGTLPIQMGEQTTRVWEQMPEPKYSIAMGVCATDGGPYTRYGYSVLPGADRKIPVNVYVLGCPPRPEALLHGLLYLREMIEKREVHSFRVLLDLDGKPRRYHYLNGAQLGEAQEVKAIRWGALAPKNPERIRWGQDLPSLGDTPESQELGARMKALFEVTFMDNPVPTVVIKPELLRPLATWLKEKEGFLRLTTLHATDLHGEIGVSYFLENRTTRRVLALETRVPTDRAELDTVSDLWPLALAQERKEWDLLGVVFKGHPALERIMLPPDWVGHPLRHDYVFPATFRGASMY